MVLRKYGFLALGLLLLLVGGIVIAVAAVQASQFEFGWTAYAPLNSEGFVPSNPSVMPLIVVGLLLMGAGIGLAAGWVGFWIGRSRTQA